MKKCFGYVRVSTTKQGEGVSLAAQRDAILRFAESSDITIVKWFEEKETAAKSGRPVFNDMVRLLKKRRADGVVMHKIDRSARNFADWAKVGDLADAGIDVHFATESLDFRSRGGRLSADIQAVIAADYIRNLRERSGRASTGSSTPVSIRSARRSAISTKAAANRRFPIQSAHYSSARHSSSMAAAATRCEPCSRNWSASGFAT